MKRLILPVLGIGALVALMPAAVRADSYWEVEHARANARAGGPVSERDAELLERYGCLSGTRSAFCQKLSGEPSKKARYRAERRARR
ncbi:MAG: hypothetical protein JNN24_06510 [Hyphomicrobium zavarzinii]|jgi:hypothetical protein|uniref:hypothetical protein n=1 Tax=Hyphomicrobium TaxID=81 RepID=UPI00035ED653|nr:MULTISPECIES: hypothetical protein [Hyphomicrobium]MBL8845407.1 hypothetical protein [Hyphomicrobium zavarzinii]WBT40270.1 hypothetical protein PE058_10405 [Hyphomicrobium sp. DMF-1]HML42374.1 hypothetical protein [Hyphomicrobium zavarzinii]